MNVVMTKLTGEHTLYCVQGVPSGFVVISKVFDRQGNLLNTANIEMYKTSEEARKRVKVLIKMKSERKGMTVLTAPPDAIKKHFSNNTLPVVSNDEMLAVIEKVKRERYVVFSDTNGIEDRFDLGVQYLASYTGSKETLDVVDRFGEVCPCFMTRFSKIEPTEDAKEAMKKTAHRSVQKSDEGKTESQKCSACNGAGFVTLCENKDDDYTETCEWCHGTGFEPTESSEKGGV